MEVILLERVEKLGSIGDVVTVKSGYGRNYLLPQNKALLANAANKARFEAEREAIEARNAEQRTIASERAENLDGKTYVLIRQSGDTGILYGSVTARDIEAAAKEVGDVILRRQVDLNNPIKTLGLHEVAVKLHAEVSIKVNINIARSEEEAERQAAGENVIEAAQAADRAEADAQAAELAEAAAEAAAERGPGEDE
jgi:large subunit ribosomal protein L9